MNIDLIISKTYKFQVCFLLEGDLRISIAEKEIGIIRIKPFYTWKNDNILHIINQIKVLIMIILLLLPS